MHELGLAESILDIVRQHVAEADAPRVDGVTVRVGDGAGVVADSLEFCFQAVVAGTPYASARLVIEHVPLRWRCGSCGEIFAADLPAVDCPECGARDAQIESGTELQVAEVELADEAPPALV